MNDSELIESLANDIAEYQLDSILCKSPAKKVLDNPVILDYNVSMMNDTEREMFKTWEEMTDLEQARCMYSDMHKDAYGFRRGPDLNWTLADFDREFAILQAEIVREEQYQKQMQAEAIERFENRILDNIEYGAKDRETAIEWIRDAECTGPDKEYLCYTLGLPYGYIK